MIHEAHSRSKRHRNAALPQSCLAYILAYLYLLLQLECGESLSADGIALLAFKKAVQDPFNILFNWNKDDHNPCTWNGVTCSPRSARVISLNVTGMSLCDECRSGNSSYFSKIQDDYPSYIRNALGQDPEGLLSSRYGFAVCPNNGNSSMQRGMKQVFCQISGTLSPEISKLSQLRVLALPFNNISGNISGLLGNLRFLRILDLQGNAFSGQIPAALGQLQDLRLLNLRNNSLSGNIPSALSECRNLIYLNLAQNKLRGAVPSSLQNLSTLEYISLSSNQLSGPISINGASCSALKQLIFSGNYFSGMIPRELGDCSSLHSLLLNSNLFEGTIPSEIGRLSKLQTLDLSMNRLSGDIPSEVGNCSQLSSLVLTNTQGCPKELNCTLVDPIECATNVDKPEYNRFSGKFPASLAGIPNLHVIWAPGAGLSGNLPSDWGSCKNLKTINLAGNSLTGEVPSGLSRCKSVVFLDLSSNQLHGSLPPEIPVSCMVVFNISKNRLSGRVPTETHSSCSGSWVFSSNPFEGEQISPIICPEAYITSAQPPYMRFYCGSWRSSSCFGGWAPQGVLVVRDFSDNHFLGQLPGPLISTTLLDEKPSYLLSFANNNFTGSMRSDLFSQCNSFQAFELNLGNNMLSGELSGEDIGGCISLMQFNVTSNYITGHLPITMSSLKNLTVLDLSNNLLNGSVPSEWGTLEKLEAFLLSKNRLAGSIPHSVGQLYSLFVLNFSENNFSGEIPESLGNLTKLRSLILNNNSLSGDIPGTLTRLTSLSYVNLAFNNLSGNVPKLGNWVSLCYATESFEGNSYLQTCGADSIPLPSPSHRYSTAVNNSAENTHPSPRHALSSVMIAAITSGCAIAIVLLVLGFLFQYTRQKMPHRTGYRSGRKEVVTFTNINFNLTYENVVRATGNFSVDNLIGSGGFGATYKAELMPGLVVAVKRLTMSRFQGVQQFDTEIRTLGTIRHSNLVTLIGYHASEAEMFLIYNYFPRGNLESFIHNSQRGEIGWHVVYKIALGIAEALAYLHDDCVPRVLHRDIKPSNILLDNNLNAFLSDFGLARLLGASETHATTDVAGTFGYVAPEYAMTCRVSDKADVYSYGVVLLELLSGKRALDSSFSEYGDTFNIVLWACMLIKEGRTHEVFGELWELGPESYLLEVLKLAVLCTGESLSRRPSMKEVVERLRLIQATLPFT